MIWTINNNGATEITRLQKNMVALEILAPSENLSPPPLLKFWNLTPKTIFFSAPSPPFSRGVHSMPKLNFFVKLENTRNLTFLENVNMVKATLKRKLVASICSFNIIQNGNLRNTCKNCFPLVKLIIYICSLFVIFQIAFRKL